MPRWLEVFLSKVFQHWKLKLLAFVLALLLWFYLNLGHFRAPW